MNALYYLNYYIYNWYKKRDNTPLIYAVLAPAALIYFNIWSIVYWGSIAFALSPPFTNATIILCSALIIIFNHSVVYHDSKYKGIFENFDKQESKSKRYRKYTFIYIVVSIALFLSTLIAADIRVDGHL